MAMSHLKQICARQGKVCQQQGLMQVLRGGLLQTDPVHAVCDTGARLTYSGMVGVRSAALVQTSKFKIYIRAQKRLGLTLLRVPYACSNWAIVKLLLQCESPLEVCSLSGSSGIIR